MTTTATKSKITPAPAKAAVAAKGEPAPEAYAVARRADGSILLECRSGEASLGMAFSPAEARRIGALLMQAASPVERSKAAVKAAARPRTKPGA